MSKTRGHVARDCRLKAAGKPQVPKPEAEEKKKPETGSLGQKAGAECQHCGKKGYNTPATCWTKHTDRVGPQADPHAAGRYF